MEVVERIESLQLRLDRWRKQSESIALVPTMGNLHGGHLRLVDQAARMGTHVLVSIFVNPAQFGPNEDFAAYPRSFEDDLDHLREHSVDLVFVPSTREIYPKSSFTSVCVPGISNILCGEFRPGHFSGVATIVLKLLNIVQPNVAVFGEKDFQQLLVIRQMVHDLNLRVEIESVATVRESDGLAMSSRNRYLALNEREIAPKLYRQLRLAADEIRSGVGNFDDLQERHARQLRDFGFRPDYFSVRNRADLSPASPGDCKLVLLAAAWLGQARLIDNHALDLQAALRTEESL